MTNTDYGSILSQGANSQFGPCLLTEVPSGQVRVSWIQNVFSNTGVTEAVLRTGVVMELLGITVCGSKRGVCNFWYSIPK